MWRNWTNAPSAESIKESSKGAALKLLLLGESVLHQCCVFPSKYSSHQGDKNPGLGLEGLSLLQRFLEEPGCF